MDTDNDCVIVTGDIFTGLKLTGPFFDRTDAQTYGEDFLSSTFKIIDIHEPEIGRELMDEPLTDDEKVIQSYFPDGEVIGLDPDEPAQPNAALSETAQPAL